MMQPAANTDRASDGYTWDTLLEMIGGEGFYAYPGNRSSDTVIGHRDNHKPEQHAGHIQHAAKRLRHYGIRLRVFKRNGRPDSLTVYGPRKNGV